MSDEKKEVRVKDLVVRADNVMFEHPERPERRERDFLFGPPRRRMEEMEEAEEPKMEENEEHAEHEGHDDHHDDDHHEDRRPPFFWM